MTDEITVLKAEIERLKTELAHYRDTIGNNTRNVQAAKEYAIETKEKNAHLSKELRWAIERFQELEQIKEEYLTARHSLAMATNLLSNDVCGVMPSGTTINYYALMNMDFLELMDKLFQIDCGEAATRFVKDKIDHADRFKK